MQAAKDTCGHGLLVFLRRVMGAALVQVPADLISFEGRLLEVELCAVALLSLALQHLSATWCSQQHA